MSDVNANIGVHIDTSSALTELKALQKQLALFHGSVSKGSAAAASAQAGLQQNLLNSINATGKFTATMGVVRSSTDSFTHSLEKNKLSMGEYFRYAGASTKTFGKLFKSEFDTIGKVAEERVKKMQTQYIKMGRDANGAIRSMAITPTTLNMKDLATQTAIAAQKQAIFNQLVKQGSTNLLNFGKNTQWAGRQLMVGFTVPLMYFGSAAAKVFMDLEKQTLKFKRVYGDMFTNPEETERAIEDIRRLADEYTKYGVEVTKTIEMAASAAAMGKVGAELRAQVESATRLSVLGGVEQEQALETTISLTNAFGIAAEDLATKINFLNAVENQTVLSIEDLTIAVPKAGPVVRQLGGDVEDLAFFMTAMKEGGINASEGANALKSGLASLINPSKKSAEFLANLGINIKGIVESNQGDLKATVIGFSQALDTLDPLNRARAIEQLFGKFQFARLSTLFQNVTKDGSQAARTLQLAGASVEELAILSERELKTVEDAIGTNFKEAVEQLKVSIAPVGKEFLKAVTPIIKFVGGLLEKFNGLSDGTKQFIVVATSLVGIIGPVLLMTFGLLANGAANIVKLFLAMRQGFMRLGGNSKLLADQTTYLNSEQLEAATVAASLNQAHTKLTQQFQLEAGAVRALRQAYIEATAAATRFAATNPGMMTPGVRGPRGGAPRKYAKGVTMVPGSGTGDTVPAMLTPGEGVVPADVMKDERAQALVGALISGKLFGYETGTNNAGGKSQFTHVGGVQKIDIDELLKDPNLSETDIRRINVFKGLLAAEGSALEADSYHGLGFSFDGKLNDRMGKAGISSTEFDREWERQGYAKWQDSGILEMDAVAFDDELNAKIKSLANSGVITDAIVEEAFKDLSPEMKKTPAYKTALNRFTTRSQYQVKKGLPTTVDGLTETFKKAVAAGYLPDLGPDGIFILDGDELGPDGKPKSSDAEKYLPKDKHVIVTRTNSDGKRVISSVWPIDKKGEAHISLNRIGSGGKRFDIKPVSTRPAEQQAIVDEASKNFKKSTIKKEPVTDLGRKIGKNPGRSFGVDGVGGFFEKSDGTRVFAKPVLNETAAQAEIRALQIARDAQGLDTPIPKMIVMKDPITGAKILGLESIMEERFTPKMMTGEFDENSYFKQTIAAALRGDADVAAGNMSGNRLTDVGAGGVFDAASGNTTYAKSMRSMEDQARIFLQEAASYDEDGKPIPRKTAFRKSTLDMVKKMSADEYHNRMIAEIDETLPKLRKLVADPKFVGDADRPVYEAMVRRLEAGRNVNWRALHEAHTGIVIQKGEALQDKKTKKVTPAKGKAKPTNVKADSGDPRDKILIPSPPKGQEVVKTRKPRKTTTTKTSAKPTIIRPGRSSAPYANPYDGMSDDQKNFEKSLRRQSQKLQKEKMAALRLEQRELRDQETLKRKIAKSKGEERYNRFSGSGMTPEQIATAKSIQRNRGTQGQISPYANSGMTKAEISKARKDVAEAKRVQSEKDAIAKREQRQVAAAIAADKKLEKEKLKKQEYKKSAEYKQQRMMRMQGVSMAAGMGASAAYMSGNTGAGNALSGVAMASAILPYIKGPFAIAALAVTAFAGSLMVAQSMNKKAAQKQSRLVDETSATTEKMKSIGELTNKVGASEIYARKRQTSVADRYITGFERGQQEFGTTFLDSEVGKSVFAGFNKDLANGGEDAVRKIALQLSAYVSDGIMTAEQAHSVASQIGINLNNQTLISQISGRMLDLIGPNGQDLLTEPLTVRMNLVQEQMATTSITKEQAASAGLPSYDPLSADDDIAEAANAYFDDYIAMFTETGPEKIGAALGGSFAQAFEFNQAQADSFSKYYDDQIVILEKQKLQTTELSKQKTITDQITALEEKRKIGLDAFRTNTKTILENIGSAVGALSDSSPGLNALKQASRTQLQDKYKGTGQELQAVVLEEKSKELQTLLQIKVNAIAGSGIVGPQALSNMIDMFGTDFAGQRELNTTLDVALTKHDPGMVESLLQQLGGLKGEVGKKIFVELIGKDPEQFNKLASTIALIQKMAGKEINIEAFFDQPDVVKKLEDLQLKLEEVEKLEGPITPKVIATIDVDGNSETKDMDALLSKWDKWKNLPDSTKKTVVQEYITLLRTIGEGDVDAEIKRRTSSARGPAAARLQKFYSTPEAREGVRSSLAANRVMQQTEQDLAFGKGGGTKDDTSGTKSRDTTLDDLLKKLKQTRDASIDAEGGIGSLRKAFKKASGDIKVFNGVNQQLRKLYKADSGFIEFIGGMDNATQKGYVNAEKLKKGIVELTADGKLAMKGYKEAQLGAFGDAANEAILQAQRQRSGFVALKSAGVESADALDMVKDANFAVSLSAATTTEEVKGLIEQFKEQRKEQEKTLIATDPFQYFNNQKDVMSQKFDVDERNIRAQYEPAIEAVQKQIDGQNEIIRLKQYELETDEKINTKKIDGINKEIDLLQRSMSIGVDKQLSALSDESAKYSEDMAVMNKTIESINEKYDLQEKALSKVSQINQDIIDKQKSQISLADALTSGDISAAAQAAQVMQEQSSAIASRSMSENIASAREAEIAGVKSTSGMTMDQIQERQYQIDRLSYALGIQKKKIEDQIAIKQEEIYQINVKREEKMVAIKNAEAEIYRLTNEQNTGLIPLQSKLQTALDTVTNQRKQWDAAQLAIDTARVNTEEFRKKVDAAEKLVKSISDLWKDIKDKDLTLTLKKIEEVISSGIPYKTPTPPTGEQTAAVAQEDALKKLAAAKNSTDINNAVKAATAAGASASTVANAMVAPLVASGMSKSDAASTARWTGQGLQYEAQQKAANAASAAAAADTSAALRKLQSGQSLTAAEKKYLGMSTGGMVPKYFSVGGMAKGTDIVPAMLTPGEFIVNAKSAKAAGPILSQINSPSFNGFETASFGGSKSPAQMSTSMYNYSVGINVNQSNASADDIANSVMTQIKYIDSQRIRGQR